MSEVLQSGQPLGASRHHPDADQLSAFLEQALPAHERDDVLAHLAICPDCREIVALTLPAVEAAKAVEQRPAAAVADEKVATAVPERMGAAAVMPSPKPKRRFVGWTIFAPAAAALAALALFVAYLDLRPGVRHKEQAAIANPQPTAIQPAPEQAPPSARAAVSGQAPPAGENELALREKGLALPQASADRYAGQSFSQFTSEGRVSQMAPEPAFQAAPNREELKKSGTGSLGGLGNGNESALREAVPRAPSAFAETQSQAAPAPPAVNSAPVPGPAPAAPAPPSVAAQTVTVESAAPVQVTPVETDEMSLARQEVNNISSSGRQIQAAILPHPLPSRQSVLSLASYGTKMLAIDIRHAVFLSVDSGRHWKAVPGAWAGHAVEANLVFPAAGGNQPEPAAGAFHGGKLATFAERNPSFGSGGNLSLTGAVTDATGAAIPGATVVVTDEATKSRHPVKTDAAGRFAAGGLAAGSYDIEAEAPGFATQQLAGLAVDPSRPNVANLTLQVGAVSQSVMVESASQLEAGRSLNKAVIAPPSAPPQPLPFFQITTDTGDRWASADGLTWKQN